MRIERIEIRDFRGFPTSYEFKLGRPGNNLLVYGENGSGKSSLFQAIKRFFEVTDRADDIVTQRNTFANSPEPEIKIDIAGYDSDGKRLPESGIFEWSTTASPAREALILQANKTKGCLDYRALLETHFVHRDRDAVEIFDLLIRTILPDVENPITKKTFAEELEGIRKDLRQPKSAKGKGIYLKRIREFNQGFVVTIETLTCKANELLREFFPDIELYLNVNLNLRLSGIRKKYLNPPKVYVAATFCKHQTRLDLHHFLNEARLSALAISLFLASLLIVPASKLRILVLDDLLIGIDHSNRVPLLKIIEDRFRDYQVFLFTHDRVWFEMAQLALENPEKWAVYEMHSKQVKEGTVIFDAPVLKPQQDKLADHFLALANEHLTVKHDLRTAALHARAAFEVKLKSYCSKHKVHVPYDLEGRHLNTDHFLQGIERRLLWGGKIPKTLFALQRIKLFRSGVLNPLAHFHPVTLAHREVDAAIKAVDKLEFPDTKADFAKITSDLLQKPALTSEETLDAACWLRTTFEVDLRGLLKKNNGKVTFRDDWTKFTLSELWDSAKEAMNRVNAAAAAPLIANIEAQRSIFLDDWNYSLVKTLDKAALDAAWSVLRTPPPGAVQTRLAAFV